MYQYYILHASCFVHSLQHLHLDVAQSWILWNRTKRFWQLYDRRRLQMGTEGICDKEEGHIAEAWRWEQKTICAVPEIRRRSEGMGWVSPFLSSIFLPREQNENMKSLDMLWYMKSCRRLQMRTDRARHKRTDGHTELFLPEAFLSWRRAGSCIVHHMCSIIWHL